MLPRSAESTSIPKPLSSLTTTARSGNGELPGDNRMRPAFASTRACSPSRRRIALTPRPGSTSTSRCRRPKARSPPPHQPSRPRSITLPKGISINSSAADGKTSCSAEQARIGFRHEAAQCPEDSKVGSLSISTSSLPAPLPGFVYLADPKPGDPYRLYLIADGFGVHVKLPAASVEADPETGQLTARLEGLPQFPFNEFNLHLFGSERGLLATPDRCGTYAVDSTFKPWDSLLPDQTSTQFFDPQ